MVLKGQPGGQTFLKRQYEGYSIGEFVRRSGVLYEIF